MKRFILLYALLVFYGCAPASNTNSNQDKNASVSASNIENKNIAQPENANSNNTLTEDAKQTKALIAYLKENFDSYGIKTTWYSSIKGIGVQGDTVIVKTDLLPRDERISRICGAISMYMYSNTNRSLGLQKVKVYGQNDNLLVNRQTINDKC